MNISVSDIAELVGGTVVGDASIRVTGLNGIKQAVSGDLTFVSDPRYAQFITTTPASAILVPDDLSEQGKTLITVADPYTAMLKVALEHQNDDSPQTPGIHETAVIAEDVEIGRDVSIGPRVVVEQGCVLGDKIVLRAGAYVGRSSKIGDGTVLCPNSTVLADVSIGKRCLVYSGAVIGSDGFGFDLCDGKRQKIPHMGTVVIGDDVEIGANTAIDRATVGQTIIGSGTKIDNLVQIGHNVEIGEHCIVCGKAGICGSAIIKDHVMLGAEAGIGGHLEIGSGAIVAGRSGVTKSIEPKQVVSGFPAVDHNIEKRQVASLRRLPRALRRVNELEKRIQELEEKLDGKAAYNS